MRNVAGTFVLTFRNDLFRLGFGHIIGRDDSLIPVDPFLVPDIDSAVGTTSFTRFFMLEAITFLVAGKAIRPPIVTATAAAAMPAFALVSLIDTADGAISKMAAILLSE